MPEREPELLFDMHHLIGHGGQADVYLVKLRATGGIYAGKFLREAWDPFARKQFRREARRQSRLTSAHVVPIVAWNLDTERPFLILEYMPHGSLADEIKRCNRFAVIDALNIAREIAVALADLHSRGVVHRDLKPGNVLRGNDGRLKLNDLGCAATLTGTEYVRTHGFVGTPAYAAPEQMRGLACPKSDVFALGVILYELLVGVPGSRSVIAFEFLGSAASQINVLVARLCANEVWMRPTAAEVVALLDDALRVLRGPRRRVPPIPATIRNPPQQLPSARGTSGSPWGWIAGAAAFLGTIAILSNGRSTWDPSVDRYRGPDGRFRSG